MCGGLFIKKKYFALLYHHKEICVSGPHYGSQLPSTGLPLAVPHGLIPPYVKGVTTKRTDTAKITYHLLFNRTLLYRLSLTEGDTLKAIC